MATSRRVRGPGWPWWDGAYHLLFAAKADLLRRAGHLVQARRYYVKARQLVRNAGERRYLDRRIEDFDAQRETPDASS